MEKTEHYGLSQWAMEDRIMMENFNSDNAIIDAALATKGNCRIQVGSYVGTGAQGDGNPVTLVFDFKPMLVFLDYTSTHTGFQSPCYYILTQGCNFVLVDHTDTGIRITWEGNSVSWYNSTTTNPPGAYQFNEKGATYHYFAIG